MICNKISVENFRNATGSVTFCEGVNILLGNNAQGKTNLLEAVWLASSARSFRATKEEQLIRFGAEFATLSVDFTDTRRQNITMKYQRGRRHAYEINKNKVTRLSDFVGRFRCVLFCPEHLSLIKGAPAIRREFLDAAISQLRPMYVIALDKYERILKQRNNLLKTALEDRTTYDLTIDQWNEQLAHEAAILSRFRASYVAQLEQCVKESFLEMSRVTGRENEVPTVRYEGSAGLESYDDLNVTKETYLRLLRQYAEREIYAGTTLVGAHKDDFEIELSGNSARMFASQGQQRSLALALKLAEGEIIKKECGEYPVFLLDDVLSELDNARRAYLIEEIRDKQVIMTTCEIDPALYPHAKIIRVENGSYRELEREEE